VRVARPAVSGLLRHTVSGMSPSITREELAALKGKIGRVVVQKAEGEILAIFVPGKLRNPLNGLKHWRAEKRYRREWHEAVANALLVARWDKARTDLALGPHIVGIQNHETPWDYVPKIPKRVVIVAQTFNRMDRDGYYAALKPVIDALTINGVIHDDAEPVNGVGHIIECSQRIDRAHRGVEIRVSLRPTPTPGGAGA